ncbi:MAG: alpha/beta fold hydrolase [Nocardiopsaceae bacterium]|nr:alpha/beta fold hydrolase [Nocardiopsaceae bacterium]
MRAAIGAAALALAAVATLTTVGYGQAAAAPSAGTGSPAVPSLSWKSCDGGFRCATARVPLNYADPRGATISVAAISHLATGPGPSLGWLFVNGGGPNPQVSSMASGYSGLPAQWRQRYNIITFDPRGMGYSTQVRCFPTEAAENKLLGGLPPFPVDAAQQAAWERAYATLDARCARHAGPVLDHDSTADIARDMNLLREAVGDPVLNYYGASYGTLLGATYANLFPATTGRMVLDGNVDPATWTAGASQLPAYSRMGSAQASDATMAAFLDLCGKAPRTACAFSAGTPAATTAKWHALLSLLARHPVRVGSRPRTVTYADAIASVGLDSVPAWQSSARTLQRIWTAAATAVTASTGSSGNSQATVPAGTAPEGTAPAGTAPAATPYASPSAPAPYFGREQQLAIECADASNPRDPAAYAAAAMPGTFAPAWAWDTEGCAGWPAAASADRYAGPWNRPTASTILVVGNTGDPATSYQDSVAMSHELARARLLTVDGYGHTTGNGNTSTCALNDMVTYTISGTLPAPGTVCQQDAPPFP